MRASIFFVTALCSGLYGSNIQSRQDDSPESKEVLNGPINEAVLVGSSVILTCEGSNDSRISWAEYATGASNGEPISDGTTILSGHPDAERYQIINNETNHYDLLIEETILNDGAKYRCTDTRIPDSRYAELIMIESNPVCTTTIPADGSIVEWEYYSIECSVNYKGKVAPIMTWVGPGILSTQSTTTNDTVWSKIEFRATSYMMGLQFTCKTNFTSEGFDDQEDSASNAPDYEYIYQSVVLIVSPPPVHGVTYTRWGRTVCGSTAEVVYPGYVAASHYNQQFGGSDYLCLPEVMEWGNVVSGNQNSGGWHYAVEYEIFSSGTPLSFANNGGVSLQDYDAVCVSCLTNRTSHLMITGKTTCPTGWTLEYRGYLVSEKYGTTTRIGQVCLDEAPQTVAGTAGDLGVGSMAVIEFSCTGGNGSPCTYGDELACVVCTY